MHDFGPCMNLSRAVRAPSLRRTNAHSHSTGVFYACCICYGGCAWEILRGLPGSDMPGLAHRRTAATLIRVQAKERSLHHISAF
jgi:hypothetical protein